MAVRLGISGIQEAQAANNQAIAALKPSGAFGRAIRVGTVAAHRYAVALTHEDTGALRASHRMDVQLDRRPHGRIFIDPNSVNPHGHKPSVYGPVEHGRGTYGLFFALAPGEQREVRLAWQLAPGTVQEKDGQLRYRLLVQKQSGTPAIPLNLAVALPAGAELRSSSPEPVEVAGDLVRFSLRLATDQVIDITFVPGAHGEP